MNSIPYRDPRSGLALQFIGERDAEGRPRRGEFVSAGAHAYPVRAGIPDFVVEEALGEGDLMSIGWYSPAPQEYDDFIPLTFSTFGEDETVARSANVDVLQLEADHSVLEVGCGSGRDSVLIADRLGPAGTFAFQDLVPEILQIAVDRLVGKFPCTLQPATAGASHLPFDGGQFDRVFHFGGFNTFGDRRGALAEMVRVTKPGGRIVVGDESMPVWLRESEFGRVLMHSSPMYRSDLPLDALPVEARNVEVRWVIGGVFYLIAFDRGVGEPDADFDFPIPGARGGTHRKRFYGQLEGIDPSLRDDVVRHAAAQGLSVSDWLEKACRDRLQANDLSDPLG